jgi:hypothetical protein
MISPSGIFIRQHDLLAVIGHVELNTALWLANVMTRRHSPEVWKAHRRFTDLLTFLRRGFDGFSTLITVPSRAIAVHYRKADGSPDQILAPSAPGRLHAADPKSAAESKALADLRLVVQ